MLSGWKLGTTVGFRNELANKHSIPAIDGGETAVYVFAHLKRPMAANTVNGQGIEAGKSLSIRPQNICRLNGALVTQ